MNTNYNNNNKNNNNQTFNWVNPTQIRTYVDARGKVHEVKTVKNINGEVVHTTDTINAFGILG